MFLLISLFIDSLINSQYFSDFTVFITQLYELVQSFTFLNLFYEFSLVIDFSTPLMHA